MPCALPRKIEPDSRGLVPAMTVRVSILDQPEGLRPPGEEQIPKRSSSDRARDLLDAKKRNQNDKKDRPQRQESGEGAAAEDGDASRERPPVEPGFDRF